MSRYKTYEEILKPLYGDTRTYTIFGASKAAFECQLLIKDSKWFMCTPLPDDYYEFRVKDE